MDMGFGAMVTPSLIYTALIVIILRLIIIIIIRSHDQCRLTGSYRDTGVRCLPISMTSAFSQCAFFHFTPTTAHAVTRCYNTVLACMITITIGTGCLHGTVFLFTSRRPRTCTPAHDVSEAQGLRQRIHRVTYILSQSRDAYAVCI